MMALDIEIGGQVTKASTVQVNTTHTRVVAFMAMIDPLAIVMELEFGSGTGGSFVKERGQVWIAKGSNVETLLSGSPSGASRGAVIRTTAEAAVSALQGNATLRQSMIDSGDLLLINGSMADFFVGKFAN